MVAVLAFVMVAAVKMPDDTVALLVKLSARSKLEMGLRSEDSVAVRREQSGQREDEAVESMLLEAVEVRRAPCSSRDETS